MSEPQFATLHLLSYETPDSIKGFSPYGPLAKALEAILARIEVAGNQQPALVFQARMTVRDVESFDFIVEVQSPLTPHVSDLADIEHLKLYAAECRKQIMAGLLAEIAKIIVA